jgi:1-aminocyclopropane-1-carboxylate deaminase/D-cysteine desulfhydrase-like pyridoxal-dependent ACC family enzyme
MTSPILDGAARRHALATLRQLPVASFGGAPTPVEELSRFRQAAGLRQRIIVKRDDAIPFGFGGNKVRKLRYLMPTILAAGADAVVTCGGVQSNHARATAAACAALGLRCHIVVNGAEPATPTGNALLNRLLGASLEYVAGRTDRKPAMARAADRLRDEGHSPVIVPLGASTPHGALGYTAAVGELLEQGDAPDVIVHACSSGGTSAGILTGVALHGLTTRVIGISADDPPEAVAGEIEPIVAGMGPLLGIDRDQLGAAIRIEVDDGFVGLGYGEPTPASFEAQRYAARHEAIFVDHTYTAKALAGLIAYCRDGRIAPDATVLFWHTGGQVALFA